MILRSIDQEKEFEIRRQLSQTVLIPKYDKKTKILICRVGSEERPATRENIIEVCEALDKAEKSDALSLVTHHSIDFVVIDKDLVKGMQVVGGQFVDEHNKVSP